MKNTAALLPQDLKAGDKVLIRGYRKTVRTAYDDSMHHKPNTNWRVEFTDGTNWKQPDGGAFSSVD